MCFGDRNRALVDCVLPSHDGSTRLAPPPPESPHIGPGSAPGLFGSRLGPPATSGIPQRPFTGRMEGKQLWKGACAFQNSLAL
jgi:hypothetical protein